jgi:hypothetical protein
MVNKRGIKSLTLVTVVAVAAVVGMKHFGISTFKFGNANVASQSVSQQVSQAAPSVQQLVAQIKIADAQNVKYDRDQYVAAQKYVVGSNVYRSIRAYAYYQSVWYADGAYTDPYTNLKISYTKLQYDHVIPLAYAEEHGAHAWTERQKQDYANDPTVGVDVNSSNNEQKGDKGPSEWLPKQNVASYCYTWLALAAKYHLSISQADMSVILNQLKNVDGSDLHVINQYKAQAVNSAK